MKRFTNAEKAEIHKELEEAEKSKLEAFCFMCKKVADLERKLEQTEKDLADYQFNYPTIKELQKENAELKAQLESERDLPAIAYMQGAEKQKKKDEEELKKWKDEWQEQVQKATDEGYARTLQTIQLNKAKKTFTICQ